MPKFLNPEQGEKWLLVHCWYDEAKTFVPCAFPYGDKLVGSDVDGYPDWEHELFDEYREHHTKDDELWP